jgi:pyruvate carboxylase subunit B
VDPKTSGEEELPVNRIKITDTSLRDGEQSILATRMRSQDIRVLAEHMDSIGFHSIEVWGGATYDVLIRYLNEDPWERLRRLKNALPNTPLQMLLRGQNLLGYRHYADDVVEAFVRHSAECGIDVFRVFDALNDERNLQTCVKAIRDCGRHCQLALCYSLTGPRMGGPVYNLDYYIDKALTFQDMGADSICIKDMAGLLNPGDAHVLIKGLKQNLGIPIQLHSHFTSGMACMAYWTAIEAGLDAIDAALAPLALRSSQPAVEPIVAALKGTATDTRLSLDQLLELDNMLEEIVPKYRDFVDDTRLATIDTAVLKHQIPGGMITSMISQLREVDALDRLKEVYEELPGTRKDLGYPPLVTPTSQIVGVQAIQNVLFGRYKMMSVQARDYICGHYGRPPGAIDPEVVKTALTGPSNGSEVITCRPADLIKPELEKAREAVRGLDDDLGEIMAEDLGNVLVYALFPEDGNAFLRCKYGLSGPPPTVETPKTLEDIKREDELIAAVKWKHHD